MFYSMLKAFEAVMLTPKFLLSANPAEYYEFLGDDVVEGQHERLRRSAASRCG